MKDNCDTTVLHGIIENLRNPSWFIKIPEYSSSDSTEDLKHVLTEYKIFTGADHGRVPDRHGAGFRRQRR